MRSSLFVVGILAALGNSCAAASPLGNAPAAPTWRCEIRLSSWCIAEGAYEITRQLADDAVHDRVWLLHGKFRPESKLVILEPNGCKDGFSDGLDLLKFESGVRWENDSWDRLQVRLKSDGTCDLIVMLTPYDGDSMEWAFTSGLPLVRPCKDEGCENVSLAQLKPQFEQRYRKSKVESRTNNALNSQ